jgi:acetylornithine deacetylase
VSRRPLHVVKLGSSTVFQEGGAIYDELARLAAAGPRVLVVAGGAAGIESFYAARGREIPFLELRNGDRVRHCSSAQMELILRSYREVTLPRVAAQLAARGLDAYAAPACDEGLVGGLRNRPLRCLRDGREVLVRDHMVGVPSELDVRRLLRLLEAHSVVCLSPPVSEEETSQPLNVDADVLAAHLANGLGADRLRLVTSTAGILTDVSDPSSTLPVLPAEGELPYVSGRMRQKVRAARSVRLASGDASITGPHIFLAPRGETRVGGPASG